LESELTTDSIGFNRNLERLIWKIDPDKASIYCAGVFCYLTMRIVDKYVLVRSPNLFYVCRGAEDNMRIVDKFNFAIGRIARRTEHFKSFDREGLTYVISKGEIIIPSPSNREKVIRGHGFKVFRHCLYYHRWDKDVVLAIRSVLAML